jgi:hypothetical protein
VVSYDDGEQDAHVRGYRRQQTVDRGVRAQGHHIDDTARPGGERKCKWIEQLAF